MAAARDRHQPQKCRGAQEFGHRLPEYRAVRGSGVRISSRRSHSTRARRPHTTPYVSLRRSPSRSSADRPDARNSSTEPISATETAWAFISRSARRSTNWPNTRRRCSISTRQTGSPASTWSSTAPGSAQKTTISSRALPPILSKRMRGSGANDELPILIVGMPGRAPLLSSRSSPRHPMVGAGEELIFWNDAAPAFLQTEAEDPEPSDARARLPPTIAPCCAGERPKCATRYRQDAGQFSADRPDPSDAAAGALHPLPAPPGRYLPVELLHPVH